jgi:hypothetical protein
MKKKFLLGIVVMFMGGGVAMNMSFFSQNNNLSTLLLANVDALATEDSNTVPKCVDRYTRNSNGYQMPICSPTPNCPTYVALSNWWHQSDCYQSSY